MGAMATPEGVGSTAAPLGFVSLRARWDGTLPELDTPRPGGRQTAFWISSAAASWRFVQAVLSL